MLISYQWLSKYLPEKIEIQTLSEILTNIGLEVEGLTAIESVPGQMAGFKIGQVLTCEQHPNADRLKVTTVDIGEDDPLQIVCGAPNVAVGQKVVVATVGSKIYPENQEPFEIKQSKLRGAWSMGMICSGKEIRWNEEDEGIMVLEEQAPVGMEAADYFNLGAGDIQIEIGLTPNRSDAFSHLGVAKDVIAYLKYHDKTTLDLLIPERVNKEDFKGDKNIEINVLDQEKCLFYSGVILEHIKIDTSPEWLQKELQTIGVKSINNVVDITNYVLHEYGQPLHAFDFNSISNTGQITVQSGYSTTSFTTLDDQEIQLDQEDLMITNGEDLLAIGGVYGGKNSGVTKQTSTIFLECAYFLPNAIRKTSMRHQLRTDAALHFEKGVPFQNVIPALERAVFLLKKYASAKIASPYLEWVKKDWNQLRTVTLKDQYLTRLSGKNYDQNKVLNLFSHLGFQNVQYIEGEYKVSVHNSHLDMHGPADLVEEIIRIDGLNAIPIPDQIQIPLEQVKTTHSRFEKEKIAHLLTGRGFYEIMTNSLVNSEDFKDRTDQVVLLNSLSQGLNILRPSMTNSGLEAIAYNLNRQQDTLRFFEFGKTYHQPKKGIYTEKEWLSIWATGYEVKDQWSNQNQKIDFFSFKKIVEELLSLLSITFNEESGEGNEWIWKIKKKEIARIQELTPILLKPHDIKQTVFYANIDWPFFVTEFNKRQLTYQPLPKFPKVERDLSLVLDQKVNYSSIEQLIQQHHPQMLIQYNLFDLFSSEQLGKDKKALAIKFHFQLNDRTLKDEEVDQYMNQMMDLFTKELGAIIRK